MAARKEPDIWIEIIERTYPGEVETTTRRSTKAMAFPTKIEGRIKAGSYSTIERALSDWHGNIEAATLSWEEEDSDGVGRQLAAGLGRDHHANPEVLVYLLSEAGRKAGLTPRVIQRGYLTRPPVPQPNRKMRYEAIDALGSRFYRFDPEAPIQTQFITREHLTPAGVFKIPAEKIDKPYNIIIGEHSDRGAATSCGTSAVKGMIPPDYIGRCVFPLGTAPGGVREFASIPPPVLSGFVYGAGGTQTYYYAVTAIFPDGTETELSNTITITGAADWENLSVTNGVWLHWTAPVGYETIYATVAHWRVCGRDHFPVATYLDFGFTQVNSDPGYIGFYLDGGHDGSRTDRDIEKRFTPESCGDTVIVTDGTNVIDAEEAWGVLVVALGAVEILNVYGSDMSDAATPARVLIEADDPNVITPLSAAWPHPDPFVEVNGTRLTLFYARGMLLSHHISGTVTFAVTVCGVEDIGDGTGTPITEAANGLQWLINEIVLNHYQTGAYGTLATYSDGTTLIKTTAFAAMQEATVGFIGGRGYQMHLAITEKVTLSEVLQWWCQTFTAHIGVTQHGQIAVFVIDPTADPTLARALRQKIEIDGPLPEAEAAQDEVENRCRFRFDWDPDSQNYRVEVITIEDLPSQAMYGICDVEEEFLGLRCTRDETTARYSMGHRIRLNKVAPVYQPLPLGAIGLERDLGDLTRVTHPDGYGVDGYVDEPFFVVRQEMELNGPQRRVNLVARYVGASLVHPIAAITATQPLALGEVGDIEPVVLSVAPSAVATSEAATVIASVSSPAAEPQATQLTEVASGEQEYVIATLSLTDAQVKALPTTPIQLIAAPGAGRRIVVVKGEWRSTSSAGAYTNLNATSSSLRLVYGASVTTASRLVEDSVADSLTNLTDLLGVAAIKSVPLHYWQDAPEVAANVDNAAVNISVDNNGSGNLTGGNAANALVVDIEYLVI